MGFFILYVRNEQINMRLIRGKAHARDTGIRATVCAFPGQEKDLSTWGAGALGKVDFRAFFLTDCLNLVELARHDFSNDRLVSLARLLVRRSCSVSVESCRTVSNYVES